MMTEEQAILLGKRAVAAGFRPMARAYILNDYCDIRIENIYNDMMLYSGAYSEEMPIASAMTNFWPDFRDPATLGILLAQVRERLNEPTLHVQFIEGFWKAAYWNGDNFFWDYIPEDGFETEAEALVAALEARDA